MMNICLCKGISEAKFSEMVAHHGACPEAVKRAMGLDGSCCGRCEEKLESMIHHVSESLLNE